MKCLKDLLNVAYKRKEPLFIRVEKGGFTIPHMFSLDHVSMVHGCITCPVPPGHQGEDLIIPCLERATMPKKTDTVSLIDKDGTLYIRVERDGITWDVGLYQAEEDDLSLRRPPSSTREIQEKSTIPVTTTGRQLIELLRIGLSNGYDTLELSMRDNTAYMACTPWLEHTNEAPRIATGEYMHDDCEGTYNGEYIKNDFFIPKSDVPITLKWGVGLPLVMVVDHGDGDYIEYTLAPRIPY